MTFNILLINILWFNLHLYFTLFQLVLKTPHFVFLLCVRNFGCLTQHLQKVISQDRLTLLVGELTTWLLDLLGLFVLIQLKLILALSLT